MSIFNLSDYTAIKSPLLKGRYISSTMLNDVLLEFKKNASVEINEIGKSVKQKSISNIKIGFGPIKILFWSQMHGNESTTTKAVIDLVNLLIVNYDSDAVKTLLNRCTLYIIPILNPDGADAYTRVNANSVDLNRDAQNLSQPESKILRNTFNKIKPDYCFNLHGQRTIFGTESSGNSAVASFLAPAEDSKLSVTTNRAEAMRVIAYINLKLKKDLPNKVGVYDDAFNINCVGDTFQSLGIPTILFEAGHIGNDYNREESRLYMFKALCLSLDYISRSDLSVERDITEYYNIPQNKKCFFDIILSNIELNGKNYNLAIQYKEVLKDNSIEFKPQLEKINDLEDYYAHKNIDFKNKIIDFPSEDDLKIGCEIDFVIANNEKISLKIY